MALQVIGSGLGRTGTLSLKLALEQLGFGPCHHMVEVFMHPESIPLWVAAGAGNGDWPVIFADYQSVVDYPGCRFWRELMDYYRMQRCCIPRAIRALVRFDAGNYLRARISRGQSSRADAAVFEAMAKREIVSRLHDRSFMIDYFNRHTEAVLAAVPKATARLRSGTRLGTAVYVSERAGTNDAVPRENSRADFQARVQANTSGGPPRSSRHQAMLDRAKPR
jgi:hypothetical protein